MGSKNRIILSFLIFVGSLSWYLTMVKSGLPQSFGLGFWGPNGHDGVWHIALANSLARGSLEMPVFAGEALQNYHIGFDLILALLHKITFISTSFLYFQIIPLVLAISIGLLTYKFVIMWKKSVNMALWSVFFVYFAGGWGWLVTFFRGYELGGESMFWSQQAISTLVNPPFAMSLVFLLCGLVLLLKLQKTHNYKLTFLAIICFGILISIKSYAGVLSLGALFLVSLFEFYKNRTTQNFKVFIGSLILSIILFIPLNRNSSGLLVWQPFWFLETMMGLSDRFGYPKFYEAMVAYRAGNPIKAILAYGIAFAIFWIGNLGTRIVKELEVIRLIKHPKQVDQIEIFISSIILAGIAIPMLLLQKGTPWNTIQFLYYSLFFSSIIAGIAISNLIRAQKIRITKYFIAISFVILTIPTTLITISQNYLPPRPPAKLSTAELDALKFLANMPSGIVLTYPYDSAKAKEAESFPPRPLYLYESTAYVAAFSQKPVYLEDEVNLTIMNYNWPLRRKAVEEFYKSTDQQFVYNFLRDNNIDYIYWVKPQRATLGETQLGLKRLYENSEVDIYRVLD